MSHSRAIRPLPTFEEINQILAYEPETGDFCWRVSLSNRSKVGGIAGAILVNGYRGIRIHGRLMYAHRLAWLLFHGCSPSELIDHVNRDKRDNRILNLRVANRSENMRNSGMRRNNTSGVKGVYWSKGASKWLAQLNDKFLGHFVNKEDAVACVRAARTLAHGSFANHGV